MIWWICLIGWVIFKTANSKSFACLPLIAALPHIGRQDEVDADQLFPSRPRFSRLLFTTLESDNGSEGDDTNVLTTATFDDIWDVADKVKDWLHGWAGCSST